MTSYEVAIVGLGPTGAVLATALGRAGVRTVVFERSLEPYSQPRACHLDAEVARILARLGFAQELPALLTESHGMEYVDRPRGRRLFTFEGFERAPLLGWHEDYVFVQPDIEAMLRRGLQAFRHVEIRRRTAGPLVGLAAQLGRGGAARPGRAGQLGRDEAGRAGRGGSSGASGARQVGQGRAPGRAKWRSVAGDEMQQHARLGVMSGQLHAVHRQLPAGELEACPVPLQPCTG